MTISRSTFEVLGIVLAVTVGFAVGAAEMVLSWRAESWQLPRSRR